MVGKVDEGNANDVIKTEGWIDFVNQVTPHKQQEAMPKHVASSCKGCAEKLALWHKVSAMAATEANFQSSAQTSAS